MSIFSAFVLKSTFLCKHRFMVQALQNPPLCSSNKKLYPTEPHCILLSYAAPSLAPLHPNELLLTILRCTVPSKLCCIPLSYAAPYLSYDAPSQLSCILLRYVAPFWATLHPIWATRYFKKYNLPRPSQLCWSLHRPAKIPVWQKINNYSIW
jgi:hypothetical protein